MNASHACAGVPAARTRAKRVRRNSPRFAALSARARSLTEPSANLRGELYAARLERFDSPRLP